MDRKLQIELLEGAPARFEAIANFWANDPAVKAFVRERFAARKAEMLAQQAAETVPAEAPEATDRQQRTG